MECQVKAIDMAELDRILTTRDEGEQSALIVAGKDYPIGDRRRVPPLSDEGARELNRFFKDTTIRWQHFSRCLLLRQRWALLGGVFNSLKKLLLKRR